MGTRYISPTGAGDKSGSSIENAAPIGALDTQIVKAGAGGQVLLIADAGIYQTSGIIPVAHGGADGLPVTIRGIDHFGNAMAAQFNGTRPVDWHAGDAAGNELFKLGSGTNHLVFQDIDISNVGTAFRASADIADITIDQVDVHNARRFFENLASGTSATISGLTIRDVTVTGFSREAIRLQYDTHDVVIENVRADMAGQVGDDLPEGIHLDGTVHGVVIRNTVMANVQSAGSGSTYLNGDGFATERGVYGVLFENTVASGNSDGGYDLKSSDTVLIGAVASENARNYRFWGEITMSDSIGLNPVWRGGSSEQNQLWIAAGAKVAISDSAFADAGSRTKVISSEGALVLDGVQIVHAADSILLTLSTLLSLVGLPTLAESSVAAVGSASAGWSANDPAISAWVSSVLRGASDDHFFGTAADDHFFVDSARDTIAEAAPGGIDHAATTLARYTLGANLENLTHIGPGDFTGTGNALANIITGGIGHDTLIGLDGNDTLNGGAGNDSLQGGNGNDTLNGGDGHDMLLGGWQADTLDGGAGDDRLIGDVNWLSTTGARDMLRGGDGNDILFGDAETMGGTAHGGVDNLSGGAGNDTLYGDAMTMTGNAVGGRDTLYGNDGDDRLYGDGAIMAAGVTGGDDRIDGGAGNDMIVGGGGHDTLIGGTGADHFVFAPGSGIDDILDFSSAEGDKIDLSAFGAAAAAYTTTMTSDGLVVHVGDSSIVLHDVFALHSYDLILM
ncbi:Type I secretion C-terminal target domain (VC_A0849 subclass) [Sphingomonas sp. EC-HK361]|uniref:calcium-binding protein n=1 Tax=Sphingomonas sp. EC-HK361 TaxID=2038397 RepID=UPI001252047F|nr:calcium-binding protein [Sphingomonas sp. EC-HK361]VVT00071.1 Type I secretion C-terminal target domain (VC_A0849 subclass) [Sphingomonas sp. EC-HK361]